MLLHRFTSGFETKKEQLRLSIIENITAILSSQPPSWNEELISPLLIQSIANLGFVNPHRVSSKQKISELSISLTKLINIFEPRLKNIKIDFYFNKKESNRLEFMLEGYYIYERELFDIALNSMINIANDSFYIKESYFA
ncbi:hypothetical protein [uncultured Shewanella sp.]|uniref:hypothetical protein n=1 Tax=uncultured Shewanella sp. TaxID=173975 RepID=UPI0026220B6D|nr:hypothetical protein [uncultured Shewanella sp.]